MWMRIRLGYASSMLVAMSMNVQAQTGIATYYTTASCQAEGTSGILTASGEAYDESAMTAALRGRGFGDSYKVCNQANGRCVTVRHNDYGPGKGPAKRGVVIDLSPAAYDALGGTRGCKSWGCYGEISAVTVEKLS